MQPLHETPTMTPTVTPTITPAPGIRVRESDLYDCHLMQFDFLGEKQFSYPKWYLIYLLSVIEYLGPWN
jgi:hypothetical protein